MPHGGSELVGSSRLGCRRELTTSPQETSPPGPPEPHPRIRRFPVRANLRADGGR